MFYMIYYKPYKGFFKTFYRNFADVTFTGVASGKRFPTKKSAELCVDSIVCNEDNSVKQDQLEIWVFEGRPAQ